MFRWARKKNRHSLEAPPAREAIQGVSLAEHNAQNPGRHTPLNQVDSLTPPSPLMPVGVPDETDVQLWIKQMLDSAPDMFDEGNLDYFGAWIDSRVGLWKAAAREVCEGDRRTAELFLGGHMSHLMSQLTQHEQYIQRRQDLEERIEDLTKDLGRPSPSEFAHDDDVVLTARSALRRGRTFLDMQDDEEAQWEESA